jgi:hypothetical protein
MWGHAIRPCSCDPALFYFVSPLLAGEDEGKGKVGQARRERRAKFMRKQRGDESPLRSKRVVGGKFRSWLDSRIRTQIRHSRELCPHCLLSVLHPTECMEECKA